MSLTVCPSSDLALIRKLEGHPMVTEIKSPQDSFEFEFEGNRRGVRVGKYGEQAINGSLYGLIELADNNPIVCAEYFSVPSASATLAQIGLGPLIRAGLVLEDPVIQFSFDENQIDVLPGLAELGWEGEIVTHVDSQNLESVYAAVCMAEIAPMDDYQVLDELFDESYGRSFFVRAVDALTWDIEHVKGLDHSVYTLRISPFEDRALVTTLVMADREGKCGAAQMIHAMNIMCGFEECLGLKVPAPV